MANQKKLLDRWKQRARELKQEVHALSLACKDPRVPWYAKLIAVSIVAYALSPIDLIPDFIPVLGYLDDLILIPFGIYLLLKIIPPEVIRDCRDKASAARIQGQWIAAGVIIAIWICLGLLALRLIKEHVT
ncbi:MAG: YkvA family protein [Candidatus Binatia bacterium]